MTKATTEGRQLVLTVDGIDEAFRVDPVPGHRGVKMTEDFLRIARSQVSGTRITAIESESLFIEALGPVNYSRMSGAYVDLVRLDVEDPTVVDEVLATFTPDGADWHADDHKSLFAYTSEGAVLLARMPRDGEPYLDVPAVRQEQCESIALCAFYWQTVVGMEAVNTFLESEAKGESTIGSVKALTLLRTRMNPSQRGLSSSASDQQQGGAETPSTAHTSATVRLPANKRSVNQNPAKRKARKR